MGQEHVYAAASLNCTELLKCDAARKRHGLFDRVKNPERQGHFQGIKDEAVEQASEILSCRVQSYF
jgi:hypothetical protein